MPNIAMPQVILQEALIRLLVEKGIFTKEELLEMIKVVDQEIREKGRIKEVNLEEKGSTP